MPIYQYQCPKCHNLFDVMKPFSEMDINELCPICHVLSERIISPSNFHLKGTGWYKTDYKDKKNNT